MNKKVLSIAALAFLGKVAADPTYLLVEKYSGFFPDDYTASVKVLESQEEEKAKKIAAAPKKLAVPVIDPTTQLEHKFSEYFLLQN
jgi:hypothetical protein